MSSAAADDRFGNPFSTRYVRPGAAPYLFPPGQNGAALVARLAQHGWRGEIVGPHGSGKSSLLAALVEPIAACGRQPLVIALHDGERRLPIDVARVASTNPPALIVVDGYEQLARWHRWRLHRLCARRGWGLLVTAHRSIGLPLLVETSPSLELAQQIVERLHPAGGELARAETAERYAARQGNLRELLFDLYDLYEARRQQDRRQHG